MILPFGNDTYSVGPSKIVALGLNYHSHIAESTSVNVRGFDTNVPKEPILFPKMPSAIVGPGDAIVLPKILGDYRFADERTDYEGELAVIVGKECRDISKENALEYVLGVTCANDVSQRNIQNGDRSGWFRGKSFDTFLPLGPRIVPLTEIDDVQNLRLRTRINGETVQDGNTEQMIFPVAETIAFISRNFTLFPGDIILTGTPAGVGPLKGGDAIDVEIDGIGTLSNTVVDPRL